MVARIQSGIVNGAGGDRKYSNIVYSVASKLAKRKAEKFRGGKNMQGKACGPLSVIPTEAESLP